MADLTIQAVSEALKLNYLEAFRYQLNDEASRFLAEIERGSEGVVGREIVMALRYGRSGGIGMRADDGILPTPNARKTKQAKWETKNIFARFNITEKVIEASKNNIGAFANLLEQTMDDLQRDAKLDLSRQALCDGTGVLATVTADEATAGTIKVDSTMYLAEGMIVDILKSDGAQRDAAVEQVEVTAIVSDTEFTFASGGTAKAKNTDVVAVSGSYGKELTGLDAVVSEDTTLYGVDRGANKWLNGRLKDIGGELTEADIQWAIDEVQRTSGSDINFLMCSYGVRRAYLERLEATKQHVNTVELKGGFKTLAYVGGDQPIPIVADKYIKPGRLYCLDLKDWKMYEMADWNWLDRDGAILTRVANKAMWEATLYKFADIGCQRPKGQVLLHGINER